MIWVSINSLLESLTLEFVSILVFTNPIHAKVSAITLNMEQLVCHLLKH